MILKPTEQRLLLSLIDNLIQENTGNDGNVYVNNVYYKRQELDDITNSLKQLL